MKTSRTVGTITGTYETPRGILAQVDGQPHLFANHYALFRAAVELLDAWRWDEQEKGP